MDSKLSSFYIFYMNAIFGLLIFIIPLQIFGQHSSSAGMPCSDPKIQSLRSIELQKIRTDDQGDRSWQQKGESPNQKTLAKMSKNDLNRRKRVGEIFGEGCLKSADDYEAAFIVYQHGNTPDHYFQAFIWAQKALERGKTNIKGDVAMAIDRYLISIEHKQLFGTQALQSTLGGCWCIQPIEDSFPQKLRDDYRSGTNAAYTGLAFLKILNAEKNCPASFCDVKLQETPKGTIPGFW